VTEHAEVPLAGGQRTSRPGRRHRTPSAGPAGVRALLHRYERVDFAGAPRFFGVDEQRREILSYVEGEPGTTHRRVMAANLRWLEEHRDELATFLA
jgi:hypothetical protein